MKLRTVTIHIAALRWCYLTICKGERTSVRAAQSQIQPKSGKTPWWNALWEHPITDHDAKWMGSGFQSLTNLVFVLYGKKDFFKMFRFLNLRAD